MAKRILRVVDVDGQLGRPISVVDQIEVKGRSST